MYESSRAEFAESLTTIRACLEAQAPEAECWRVIEEWCGGHEHGTQRGVSVWPSRGEDDWRWLVYLLEGGYRVPMTDFPAATRLEALQAAAAWIKKEGSK